MIGTGGDVMLISEKLVLNNKAKLLKKTSLKLRSTFGGKIKVTGRL